ncbi:MAG: amidohydrolase family protein [Nannocystis sp.]|nr:amidohydrolase family protein [Nannocystis sp.]
MRPIVIRAGLVIDGTQAPARAADVLLRDGLVSAISPHLHAPEDAEIVEAAGCWVLPGFIDNHTHYDAEVALAPHLGESVRHGVTTVFLGSCSISFVAADADDCSDLFTRVEGVPREHVLPLLREIKTWRDPAGWRDWIDRHPLGANVAAYLGHSDIRAATMGLSAAVDPRARPSSGALAAMERLLEQALDCGLLGLSEMTNPWDRLDGDREWSKSLPSSYARAPERRRLHAVLRRRGAIHQTAPNLVTRVNVLRMVLESGGFGVRAPLRTTLISMMDLKADSYIYGLTHALAFITNRVFGGDLRWQSPPVPFDLYYDGMDSVLFEEFPAGQAIRDLARDLERRRALLRDPTWRRAFRRELRKRLAPRVWHRDLSDAVILACPDPAVVGRSFTQVAEARGQDPASAFIDLLTEHDSALRWHTCLANHRPEVLARIMNDPGTLIGFSDAGAHLRSMAFYNFPLRMLKRVLDAERSGRPIMTLERAVHRLTGEQAAWFGLDVGVLAEGRRADLAVIDPTRLDERVEQIHLAPFPELGGLERCVNRGDAARHVYVGGVEVARDGEPLLRRGARRCGTFLAARRGADASVGVHGDGC